MPFRKVPVILMVLTMCTGFLPGQTQSGSETGIEGVITSSPIQPAPCGLMLPVHDPSRTRPSWWKIKRARLRHLPRTIRGAFGHRWRRDTTKFPSKERQAASGATGRSRWTLLPAKRRKSSGSATRACDNWPTEAAKLSRSPATETPGEFSRYRGCGVG